MQGLKKDWNRYKKKKFEEDFWSWFPVDAAKEKITQSVESVWKKHIKIMRH